MIELSTPEVVDATARTLVGVADTFDRSRRADIPALYERFFGLRDQFSNVTSDVLYGVSMDQTADGTFRYGVGTEVSQKAPLPDGACFMYLSAGPHAVFSQRTPMTDLPQRFDLIFSEWLPQAPFTLRDGAVFERYPDDSHPEEGKMYYEIWVPVTPRP